MEKLYIYSLLYRIVSGWPDLTADGSCSAQFSYVPFS